MRTEARPFANPGPMFRDPISMDVGNSDLDSMRRSLRASEFPSPSIEFPKSSLPRLNFPRRSSLVEL